MSFASGGLARLARVAVTRSNDDPSEALVAIVFSAVAAESLVADIVGAAHLLADADAASPDVQRVLDYATRAGSHPSVTRLRTLQRLLTGRSRGAGDEPWAGFKVLTRARNFIVHAGPRRFERPGQEAGAMGGVLRYLERQGVLPSPRARSSGALICATSALHDSRAAQWAYGTAHATVRELFDGAPRTALTVTAYAGVRGWEDEPAAHSNPG